MLDNVFRKIVQSPRKIVGEYINEGDTVVDLGCGPGFFSVEMAKMAGKNGQVIAVDLQPEMLEKVRRKAGKKNVPERIRLHQTPGDKIGLELKQKADFILAFYMIHETPNPAAFLEEAKSLLKKDGKFLVVEPKMHVDQTKYEEMIQVAKNAGFRVLGFPKKKGGRSVLLSIAE